MMVHPAGGSRRGLFRPVLWYSILAVSVALLLGGCSTGAPRATGSSGGGLTIERRAIGGSFEVEGTDEADTSKTATVKVTLVSCENEGDHLPEGHGIDDLSFIYDDDLKAYNKENGYWSVDDTGAISKGWNLVVARLRYSNDNDFACRIDLAKPHISHLDSDRNLVAGDDEQNWVLGGVRTKEDYYRPQLAAHSQAEWSVGFFVRTKGIARSNLLVMGATTANSNKTKVFSLGGLTARTDTSSSK